MFKEKRSQPQMMSLIRKEGLVDAKGLSYLKLQALSDFVSLVMLSPIKVLKEYHIALPRIDQCCKLTSRNCSSSLETHSNAMAQNGNALRIPTQILKSRTSKRTKVLCDTWPFWVTIATPSLLGKIVVIAITFI